MGPRLISRGNNGSTVCTNGNWVGFNGAAADQPRKDGNRTLCHARCRASMGPRLISRGNLPVNEKSQLLRPRFNGAATDQSRK